MVQNLHIVVGDVEGKLELVHLSNDFAEAHKAFDQAAAKFEAVRIFDFPLPTRLRYPAQEAIDTKQRLEISQSRDNAAEVARQARLKELRAQHADVTAELKTLGGLEEPAAEEKEPKAEKSTKGKKAKDK